jgi:hypothetical protein
MFSMVQFHKYSLAELENMMPWEKFIYIDLLSDHLKRKEEERRDQEAVNKARPIKRR